MKRQEDKWDESYSRNENYIFFPKEEVVKFLARNFKNQSNENQKALDFGCGIGRQTFLLNEFGFDAHGCDISKVALEKAKDIAPKYNFEADNKFIFIESQKLPFKDKSFQCVISDCVLDSMSFENAQKSLIEINRICSGLVFISLIGTEANKEENYKAGDFIVQDDFENGTIQSYYDHTRINELLNGTNLKLKDLYSMITTNNENQNIYRRYYLTLESI